MFGNNKIVLYLYSSKYQHSNMKREIFEGDNFATNNYGSFEVVAYKNRKEIDIRFHKTGYLKTTDATNIRRGRIKDLFYPSIFNIGYIGEGKHFAKKNGKIEKKYQTWFDMLERSYSEKLHIKFPAYAECSVATEWHNFQNFGDWFDKNYVEGWQLDKDILVKDNKIYSSETCCFVPREINVLFSSNGKSNDLPLGVNYFDSKNDDLFYSAQCSIDGKIKRIGRYRTIDEAFVAYKNTKEENIKKLAEKHKNKLNVKTYLTLINYSVSKQ